MQRRAITGYSFEREVRSREGFKKEIHAPRIKWSGSGRNNVEKLLSVGKNPEKFKPIMEESKFIKSDAMDNDGKLYEKSRIRDKFWKGPLSNSMPDNKFLRMITLDSKENLLGITDDGSLYRKMVNDNNKRNRYNGRWERLPNLQIPLIYLINEVKDVDNIKPDDNDILLGLDYSGLIVRIEYSINLGIISTERLANDLTPVLKLYYDKNGYLMGLNTDLHLIRKETLKYDESEFNTEKINPSDIIDVIYDIDGKMFGLVPIINKRGNFNTLMKQNLVNYQSKFLPLDLSDIKGSNLKDDKRTFVLNDTKIIELKTGVNLELEQEKKAENYGYNNINEAIERTDIEDLSSLRELCASRTFPDDNVEYANFELLNRMEIQQKKINDLNDILIKLQEASFKNPGSETRTKLQ